jgi:hypothetical protein
VVHAPAAACACTYVYIYVRMNASMYSCNSATKCLLCLPRKILFRFEYAFTHCQFSVALVCVHSGKKTQTIPRRMHTNAFTFNTAQRLLSACTCMDLCAYVCIHPCMHAQAHPIHIRTYITCTRVHVSSPQIHSVLGCPHCHFFSIQKN